VTQSHHSPAAIAAQDAAAPADFLDVSFEATIERIGQIEQMFDPAAAAASSSAASAATTATSGSGSSTGSTSASFAAALAQAQSANPADLDSDDTGDDSGDDLLASVDGPTTSDLTLPSSALALTSPLASLTTPTTTGTTEATSVADPRVQAMIQTADSLVGKPYVWGGGHSGWGPQAGYDCSGFVSAVLHGGGYLSSPQDTTTLPTAPGIEAGPGQYVTIYDRDASGQEGHVIIDIAGQFYESGGQAGAWGGGGGVEKIATPSASYLATFNDVLHPAGL